MTVPNRPRGFIKQRVASFAYAIRGIVHLIRSETNARIHLALSCTVVAAGFLSSLTVVEWCLIVLVMGLVWTAEAVNTAIERAVELAGDEFSELAGRAKDLAAGAVLLAAITAAVVGILVFFPVLAALLE